MNFAFVTRWFRVPSIYERSCSVERSRFLGAPDRHLSEHAESSRPKNARGISRMTDKGPGTVQKSEEMKGAEQRPQIRLSHYAGS
ncbi:hypothetical protein DOTSEDRAFT_72393 [Dothistroma septosporum NZE10]|uniref:Uncharacterized protein n=1 Tax=Dothistroma septosporum (strain NZE10 / CBS 128990) TaxID=675120 RepID=M2YM30_DOTSN|nr:hypothetical protein DOTSEDRAFT_72393 [Dothistroma septosporum NZE10]